MGRPKIVFSRVQESFIARGFKLLSHESEIDTYKTTRLRYLCDKHGEQTILWNNFMRGAGCKKCAQVVIAEKTRKPFGAIADGFKQAGYDLITCGSEYRPGKFFVK